MSGIAPTVITFAARAPPPRPRYPARSAAAARARGLFFIGKLLRCPRRSKDINADRGASFRKSDLRSITQNRPVLIGHALNGCQSLNPPQGRCDELFRRRFRLVIRLAG